MRKRTTPKNAKSLGINLAAFGVPAKPKKPGKKRGQMNKLEAAFCGVLTRMKDAGRFVHRVRYEAVTLLAARVEVGDGKQNDTKYTPDFQVTLFDRTQVFFEVKGHRRPQDILRLRMAANEWPEHAFFLVTRKTRKSPWTLEPFGQLAATEHPHWQQAIEITTALQLGSPAA